LPSILILTPTPTPTPSAATAITLHHDTDTPGEGLEELLSDDEEPMERYHIEVPPLLPGTSSWKALQAENLVLRDIIVQAGIALEEDDAQMKLTDLENKRLRKQVFDRAKRKTQNKLTSGRARHMTATENLDFLARQDWERGMKDVFREAGPRFKVLKKSILDYQKAIEKVRKVAEQEAKKVAAVSTGAERARGHGRGTRGGRRGGGRGARGRGGAVAEGSGACTDDVDSEPSGAAESLGSDSDSDSESEAEIPIPRSHQQRQIRVIQGRREEAAVREVDQEVVVKDGGKLSTLPV
jgi:hypothetical protein